MRRLTLAPRQDEPATFNPIEDYPEDVNRLVEAAQSMGFEVTPLEASAIWLRYSDGLCAAWLPPAGDAESIVREMLKHAVVDETPQSVPPPPAGYDSWVDYAVDNLDVTSLQLEGLCQNVENSPTRDDFRRAAKQELRELKRRAGVLR